MEAAQVATYGTRRVLVVANHPAIVYAVRRALRHVAGFRLIGYVTGAAPIGAVVADTRPDVVVVDDLGAAERAIARIDEARGATPAAKIVLLVPGTEHRWLDDAARAGAHAVLSKGVDPASAGTLLREIVRGTVFHCLPDPAARPPQTAPDLGLTHRELQILRLVASGAPNSRLAQQLCVTEQTVKFHLSNIYRKLGVANRTQASHFAYMHGLVEPIAPPVVQDVAVKAA
jgi:DNA-binding NarL/FixJ family response regulator